MGTTQRKEKKRKEKEKHPFLLQWKLNFDHLPEHVCACSCGMFFRVKDHLKALLLGNRSGIHGPSSLSIKFRGVSFFLDLLVSGPSA